MKQSDKFNIELGDLRRDYNKLAADINAQSDDPTEDQSAKLTELRRRGDATETRYEAALVDDQDEEEKRAATDDPDGEHRELFSLFPKASLIPFIDEKVSGRIATGAEHELRAAVFGDAPTGLGSFPLELLAPVVELERRARWASGERMEHRVDAATSVAAGAATLESQAAVLERVFTRNVAGRLGVAMPSVPVGQQGFPVMLTGTTAALATDGTEIDAGAATFSGAELEPIRASAAYLFNERDTFRLRGYEDVLRRDLVAVLSDDMDDQVVNGDGSTSSGITNVTGFIAELPAVSNPSGVTTWADFVDLFTGMVDGVNSYDVGDLRAIIGAAGFAFTNKLFRSTASRGPRESAFDFIRERLGGVSVSSRIPAPSSDIQTGIVARTSYPGRNAVMPIWRQGAFLVDPYSRAAQGQVRLTVTAFFNFKILRETGWALFKTKHA